MGPALTRKLSSARKLAVADWGVLFEAWIELLWAQAALAALPFAWCRRTLEKAGTTSMDERVGGVDVERIVRLQRMAARHHLRHVSCLPKALVLNRMLRRRGVPSRVIIGAKRAGEFSAHAWVEIQGKPIDDETDGYTPFGDLTSALKAARRF